MTEEALDYSDERVALGILQGLGDNGYVATHDAVGRRVFWLDEDQMVKISYYRNVIVHFFVPRALSEMALHAMNHDRGDVGHFRDSLLHFRDLLKFEFFFPERQEFAEQIIDEVRIIVPEWDENTPDDRLDRQFLGALTDSGFVMAHRVLRSFFDAQLVVAERLAARASDAVIDRKEFIDECVAVGKQMLLQQRLHSAESVSSELFTSAWKLADNHGLIAPSAPGEEDALLARRQEFAERLRDLGERIARAASLDPSNRTVL